MKALGSSHVSEKLLQTTVGAFEGEGVGFAVGSEDTGEFEGPVDGIEVTGESEGVIEGEALGKAEGAGVGTRDPEQLISQVKLSVVAALKMFHCVKPSKPCS